jgi:hypothetical protein
MPGEITDVEGLGHRGIERFDSTVGGAAVLWPPGYQAMIG